MFRHSWRASVCAVAVVAAGCAARQPDVSRLPSEVMSGHVTTSATGAWFTPCAAGSPKWWVTFMEASIQQAERAKASGLLANGEATYVRWRASQTDERHAGPGGPAVLVREILEIRAARADDCPRGSSR